LPWQDCCIKKNPDIKPREGEPPGEMRKRDRRRLFMELLMGLCLLYPAQAPLSDGRAISMADVVQGYLARAFPAAKGLLEPSEPLKAQVCCLSAVAVVAGWLMGG
jgi:hypothetical protein